ncbi:MAG: phosphopantetheine adenylyltransferase [Xanthomonadaceae bacterium]|nr:phosphopantetheine adenylyltransferase [Xanthomonadaceae bacterium]
MRHLIPVGLLIAAIIHLLPLAGVLGGARLERLYGIPVDEPNLDILLRHRAVLFGLLGLLLLTAAFLPTLRPPALIAGIVSAASFLVIVARVGMPNAAIARVVTADWVALCSLLVAAAVHAMDRQATG